MDGYYLTFFEINELNEFDMVLGEQDHYFRSGVRVT